MLYTSSLHVTYLKTGINSGEKNDYGTWDNGEPNVDTKDQYKQR